MQGPVLRTDQTICRLDESIASRASQRVTLTSEMIQLNFDDGVDRSMTRESDSAGG